MRILIASLFCVASLQAAFFEPGTDQLATINGAGNFATKSIFVLATVTTDQVLVQIGTAAFTDAQQATIDSGSLAWFSIPDISKALTSTEISNGSDLELTFSFTSYPNPAQTGGYQVSLEMLLQRLNLNLGSSEYYNFQGMPLISTFSNLFYSDVLFSGSSAKRWIEQNAGVLITPDWNDNQVLVVNNSFGTSSGTTTSATLKIDNGVLTQLISQAVELAASEGSTQQQYWTSYILNMQTYFVSEIEANLSAQISDLVTQVTALENQITLADGFIEGTNSTNQPTAQELANAQANRTLLINTLTELLSDLETHWAQLARDNASESETITTLISDTEAFIATEKASAANL